MLVMPVLSRRRRRSVQRRAGSRAARPATTAATPANHHQRPWVRSGRRTSGTTLGQRTASPATTAGDEDAGEHPAGARRRAPLGPRRRTRRERHRGGCRGLGHTVDESAGSPGPAATTASDAQPHRRRTTTATRHDADRGTDRRARPASARAARRPGRRRPTPGRRRSRAPAARAATPRSVPPRATRSRRRAARRARRWPPPTRGGATRAVGATTRRAPAARASAEPLDPRQRRRRRGPRSAARARRAARRCRWPGPTSGRSRRRRPRRRSASGKPQQRPGGVEVLRRPHDRAAHRRPRQAPLEGVARRPSPSDELLGGQVDGVVEVEPPGRQPQRDDAARLAVDGQRRTLPSGSLSRPASPSSRERDAAGGTPARCRSVRPSKLEPHLVRRPDRDAGRRAGPGPRAAGRPRRRRSPGGPSRGSTPAGSARPRRRRRRPLDRGARRSPSKVQTSTPRPAGSRTSGAPSGGR